MVAVLEKPTTIYAKGQTTVPVEVRNALGVVPGDSITFCLGGDGTVCVRKTEDPVDAEDPALEAFLTFLAEDVQRRPQEIRPMTESLEQRLRELTAGVQTDRRSDRIEGDVGL